MTIHWLNFISENFLVEFVLLRLLFYIYDSLFVSFLWWLCFLVMKLMRSLQDSFTYSSIHNRLQFHDKKQYRSRNRYRCVDHVHMNPFFHYFVISLNCDLYCMLFLFHSVVIKYFLSFGPLFWSQFCVRICFSYQFVLNAIESQENISKWCNCLLDEISILKIFEDSIFKAAIAKYKFRF